MDDNGPPDPVTDGLFSPILPARISGEIVQQIKWAIRDGRLRAGDRLPPERELAARFETSRVSVRDALRVLEAGGLIEIRVGARGGAFVTAPAPTIVGENIANMLALATVTPAEVTEARIVFELGIIPLVCDRATDQDVADLEEICWRSEAALGSGGYRVELSAEFHARLARCSHNAAVAMLVDSFQDALVMSLQRAKELAPEMGRKGIAEHRKLVEAVGERDAAKAQRIMTDHLGRTAARLGLEDIGARLGWRTPE